MTQFKDIPKVSMTLLFQDVSERQPEELGNELIGVSADIFGILRAAKMNGILSDFQMKMNREDIVIRFYEDFLTYKPQIENAGVFITHLSLWYLTLCVL